MAGFPGSYWPLRQLIEQPSIVEYEHCHSSLASNGSVPYVIQGTGETFQSIYCKRCNGSYINAIGTRPNGTFRSTNDKGGYLRSEAWTQRQTDSRWENNVWKLSGEMSSCAQEQASDENRKQGTLMLMQDRVRREECTCENLIAQAWGTNGGEHREVTERMRGWWRKIEAGVQALRIGGDNACRDVEGRTSSRWKREVVYARLSAILKLLSPCGMMNGDGVQHK